MLEATLGHVNLGGPPPGPGSWSILPIGQTSYLGRAIAYGGNIFIFGGRSPTNPTNGIRKFNTSDRSWSSAGTLPWAGESSVAAVIGGLIYVHGGGGTGTTRFGNLVSFNPVNGAITELAPYVAARAASGVAILGKLYVFGGESTVPLNSLRCYDPATNKWTTLDPGGSIPTVKYYHDAVVVDNKMYVVSGFSSGGQWIKTMDVYDPVLNIWEPTIELSFGVYAAAVVAIGRRIYVAGGVEQDSNYVDTTRVYDVATKAWTIVKPMPKKVSYMPFGVVDSKLYTFGGYVLASGGPVNDTFLYTPT